MWPGIAAAVLGLGGWSDAADIASGGAVARTVAWSYASFQAERQGNRVTADIRMADLPAATEQAGFLRSPRGTGFKLSGREVVKLSIRKFTSNKMPPAEAGGILYQRRQTCC